MNESLTMPIEEGFPLPLYQRHCYDQGIESGPPSVPEDFQACADNVYRQLAFAAVGAEAAKEVLWDAYAQSYQTLHKLQEAFREFLRQVLSANVQVKDHDRTLVSRLGCEAQDLLTRVFPDPAPEQSFTSQGWFALAERSPQEICRALKDRLQASCRSLLERTVSAFDALVHAERVGLLEWSSVDPQVARYHFYRESIRHEVTAQAGPTRSTAKARRVHNREVIEHREEQVVTHTETISRQHIWEIHGLLAAAAHPLPAEHVKRPQRVREILQAIPSWLTPLTRIVTGQECHRLVIVHELPSEVRTTEERRVRVWREERPLSRPDPALVVGPYVLSGWSEEEVLQEEKEAQDKKRVLVAAVRKAAEAAEQRRIAEENACIERAEAAEQRRIAEENACIEREQRAKEAAAQRAAAKAADTKEVCFGIAVLAAFLLVAGGAIVGGFYALGCWSLLLTIPGIWFAGMALLKHFGYTDE